MKLFLKMSTLSLLAASTLAVVSSQRPAVASPTPFHSVDLNVHGYFVGALTYAAANLHPLNIMAQEVCSPGFTNLHNGLVAQGYAVRSYAPVQASSGAPGAACTVAGQTMYNVVASGGTTAVGDAWAVRYPDQAPGDIGNSNSAQRDYRGFVCMRS